MYIYATDIKYSLLLYIIVKTNFNLCERVTYIEKAEFYICYKIYSLYQNKNYIMHCFQKTIHCDRDSYVKYLLLINCK